MLTQGEVDGDLSYQAWADAEENAEVADLLRLNGREETRHSERVGEVKRLLAFADKCRAELGDSLKQLTGTGIREPGRVAGAPAGKKKK